MERQIFGFSSTAGTERACKYKVSKKPKRSIESLSPTKSSEPLFGKHLHDYLVKKLHQAAFQ